MLAPLVLGIWMMFGGVESAVAGEPHTGPPVNEVAPSIKGAPREGANVKGVKGTWTGAKGITYAYQWRHCDASGNECEDIAGAVKTSYKSVAADVGNTLRVTITATNPEGSANATSAPSSVVAAAPPKKKGRVTITGPTIDGRVLTMNNGTFKGTAPFMYTYQWFACVKKACSSIAGATSQSYRAQTADIGKTLKGQVTATNSAGSAKEPSKKTKKVTPGSPLNLEPPTISGSPTVGQTLSASTGTWVGTTPFEFTYQWRSCNLLSECSDIAGATESTYTVQPTDLGNSFEVVVTAKNAYGSASATSARTGGVGGGSTAPENLIAPLITGLTVTGQTVNATTGTWTGTEPITYTYQWQLCNASGAACEEIAGATESSYSIPAGDVGKTLRVTVTATNVVGSAPKTSEPSTQIIGNPPVNTELPVVSGTATAGQLLTTSNGKWTGDEPITYSYEWERCNAAGASCLTIAGQTLPLYALTGEDVGHTIRSVVTAKNIVGTASAESEPTAVVKGVVPENLIAPLITGLTVTGQTVNATTGTWTGTEPITYTYQWQLCNASGAACEEVSGATESSYTIPPGDGGKTLRVVVTAKNVAGSTPKTSEPSTQILGNPPVNTELPVVSGTTTAGQLLTTSNGKWTGDEPITYSYKWERCNASGESCTEIAGQTLPVYLLAGEDVGHTIRSVVTAKNIAGTASAESGPTSVASGVVPANVIAPLITGLAATGQTLSATTGTWTGTEPITYSYQWKFCNASGAACSNIGAATNSTFTIPAGHVGETIRVTVTAKNVAGSTEKDSEATLAILAEPPSNTELPAVTGTTTAGQLLTTSNGKWSGTEPITFTYKWLRCNESGGSCTTIAGQALPLYTLTGEDVKHTIRSVVIAKNIAGEAEATSNATAVVAGVIPANLVIPLVTGLPKTGETLSTTNGTWTGTEPFTYTYQWKICTGASCTNQAAPGGTKSTFVIPAGNIGKTVKVEVKASNVAGEGKAESLTTTILL